MIDKRSRYNLTLHYSDPAVRSAVGFRGTRPRAIESLQGVLEHKLLEGDRLDLLALHYYNDPHKWWLILDANPQISYAGEVDLGRYSGQTIVIPRDPS